MTVNVSDWSETPASNTSVDGISIAENCSPANINNAIRSVMAGIKTFSLAIGESADYQPLDATLTDLAALVTAADKGIYTDGADSFATFDQTAYGRTLQGYASAAALKAALGVVTVTASSLGANGYISFDVNGDGAADITIQWGTGTFGSTTTFPANFTSACWAVVPFPTSLIGQSDEADEHLYVSSSSTSGFVTAISGDYSAAPTLSYIAIGR